MLYLQSGDNIETKNQPNIFMCLSVESLCKATITGVKKKEKLKHFHKNHFHNTKPLYLSFSKVIMVDSLNALTLTNTDNISPFLYY